MPAAPGIARKNTGTIAEPARYCQAAATPRSVSIRCSRVGFSPIDRGDRHALGRDSRRDPPRVRRPDSGSRRTRSRRTPGAERTRSRGPPAPNEPNPAGRRRETNPIRRLTTPNEPNTEETGGFAKDKRANEPISPARSPSALAPGSLRPRREGTRRNCRDWVRNPQRGPGSAAPTTSSSAGRGRGARRRTNPIPPGPRRNEPKLAPGTTGRRGAAEKTSPRNRARRLGPRGAAASDCGPGVGRVSSFVPRFRRRLRMRARHVRRPPETAQRRLRAVPRPGGADRGEHPRRPGRGPQGTPGSGRQPGRRPRLHGEGDRAGGRHRSHQECPARAADRQDRPRRARRPDGPGRRRPSGFEKDGPTILMLCGLQGAGKTTTCGKLARLLATQGSKPLLVAADLQRPAAVEQLRVIGAQLGIPVFIGEGATDPVKRLPGCRRRGQSPGARHDHPRHRRPPARRRRPDGPSSDPDREEGQAAPGLLRLRRPHRPGRGRSRPRSFNKALELDGVILTKLDGDARGGAALSVKASDRGADQVRRQGGEARQAGSLRPRAARRPDARHGRHRRPGREAANPSSTRTRRSGSRRSWPRGSSTSTTSASRSSR